MVAATCLLTVVRYTSYTMRPTCLFVVFPRLPRRCSLFLSLASSVPPYSFPSHVWCSFCANIFFLFCVHSFTSCLHRFAFGSKVTFGIIDCTPACLFLLCLLFSSSASRSHSSSFLCWFVTARLFKVSSLLRLYSLHGPLLCYAW